MRYLHIFFLLLLFALPLSGELYGAVTLTEVLANEPGGSVYLEWVEIYNTGPQFADISGWFLVEGGDRNEIPGGAVIPPGQFAVLSRHPISEDTSKMSFERHWGDSSGYWGDSPEEDFPLIEVKMSLKNSGGKVFLSSNGNDSLSGFTWHNDAGDGTSYEKQDVDGGDILSNWATSSSVNGSTPGRAPGTVKETGRGHLSLELDPEVVFLQVEQSTKLTYTVLQDSKLTLKLFDINGKHLRTLYDDESDLTGEYIFDCRDESGNMLTGGIYIFYARVEGAINEEIKKMLVVAGQ